MLLMQAATTLKEEGADVTMGKVNIVEEPTLGSRFKVLEFPTIKVFTKGSDAGELYEGVIQQYTSICCLSHVYSILKDICRSA
jgi:hypothetical protein